MQNIDKHQLVTINNFIKFLNISSQINKLLQMIETNIENRCVYCMYKVISDWVCISPLVSPFEENML